MVSMRSCLGGLLIVVCGLAARAAEPEPAGTVASRPSVGTTAQASNLAKVSRLEPIVIFRDPARYTTFPDIKPLSGGRLICVFRDASFPERIRHIEADARIVACISQDGGRTWSSPSVIYDDPHCQNDPSVAVLRDGRLALTFFNWVGRSAAYVEKHKPPLARRVDRGEWGDYAEPGGVHLVWGYDKQRAWQPEARHIGGTATRLLATSSSILEMKNGKLLLPVYGRSPEAPVDRAYIFRSTDSGMTWSDEILIAADPDDRIAMQEPALAQMPDGRVVALLRTANAGDHLYVCSGDFNGNLWTPPKKTPLIGHPADLQVLPDGRLLAVYGYRHDPWGVRGCISDDGVTWDREREFVIEDTGAHTDLGYPSVCLTDDKHVIVAYYINGKDTKERWIACKRIPLAWLK